MSEKLSLNNKNNSKKNYKLKENLLPCNGLLTILETTFPLTKLQVKNFFKKNVLKKALFINFLLKALLNCK
jgi:hypothetical protein